MKPARYMLDANTVSYILGGKSAKARQRLLELKSGEEICISVITEAEVRYGVRKRPVTPETRLASKLSWSKSMYCPGLLRRLKRMLRSGPTTKRRESLLGNLDMLIAAHSSPNARFW